jgi:hypothetical protein
VPLRKEKTAVKPGRRKRETNSGFASYGMHASSSSSSSSSCHHIIIINIDEGLTH